MNSILRSAPHLKLAVAQRRQFWSSAMDFLAPKTALEPLTIFHGIEGDSLIKSIKNHSDTDYGGGSTSIFDFHSTDDQKAGFVRWSGELNFTKEHAEATKANGGFCAIKVDYKSHVDLLDYEGLSFNIRTAENVIVYVNLKCQTYIENDMYQLRLAIKGNPEWKKIFTPFHLYQLTSGGHSKEQPMQNDHLQLESISLMIKDKVGDDGQFEIDIRHIQALHPDMHTEHD
mmetsp:Transcript_9675/g.15995  ORF Transcript_9675/g.15995 Transcript_9675/m.15995 type:complete len:229 (-) Transcript_9675:186-872(-)